MEIHFLSCFTSYLWQFQLNLTPHMACFDMLLLLQAIALFMPLKCNRWR